MAGYWLFILDFVCVCVFTPSRQDGLHNMWSLLHEENSGPLAKNYSEF